MNPSASIVVLNWNGRQHLKDCLDSLSSLDYPNYGVVLVDNASTDDSVEFVTHHYPKVHILQNRRNLGFAEGNNVGIRHALSGGADYVVLLNNDTRVEHDFLTALIRQGEANKKAGVLGGTVLMFFNPLIVNSTGVHLNQLAYGWDRDFGEEVRHAKRNPGEVLAVTGSLMAVKRDVFEKVGLLDASFFAYFEDVDFCMRVWKYTDYTVEYVPGSVIYHKFSASVSGESSLKRSLMLRNQYRIFFKHFPLRKIVSLFPLLLLQRSGALLASLVRRDLRFFFTEFFIMTWHVVRSPLALLFRVSDALRRSADEKRFWDKVLPERTLPSFKPYDPDYAQVVLNKNETKPEGVSPRIVMGVNDDLLGEGWSRLIPGSPLTRRVTERAVCFLRNKEGFRYLQIHGLWDSQLHKRWFEVTIEGQIVGSRVMERGWHTYILPFENRFEVGPVEVHLRVEPLPTAAGIEPGFAINEIGLFPLGSPILRWIDD